VELRTRRGLINLGSGCLRLTTKDTGVSN
jgi:hypothetical protein